MTMAQRFRSQLASEIANVQARVAQGRAAAAPLLDRHREFVVGRWNADPKNRDPETGDLRRRFPSEADIRHVLMKEAEPVLSGLADVEARFAGLAALKGVLEALDEFDQRLDAYRVFVEGLSADPV